MENFCLNIWGTTGRAGGEEERRGDETEEKMKLRSRGGEEIQEEEEGLMGNDEAGERGEQLSITDVTVTRRTRRTRRWDRRSVNTQSVTILHSHISIWTFCFQHDVSANVKRPRLYQWRSTHRQFYVFYIFKPVFLKMYLITTDRL